ncbi:MAG TPA: NFACT family protein [Candidatus Atribacteria bacterium]|mgnify:FL=1|nr:NFACT family protein [Candidatus Atribacteria bacterium]
MKILEGLALRFLIEEIEKEIKGARIQRVFTTTRKETWLEVYSFQEEKSLVISLHPQVSFIFTTSCREAQKEKPDNWQQLLNKYLVGGKIISLAQVGWDRVVRIEIKNPHLFEEGNLYLFVELTGRNTNAILTDQSEPPHILGVYRRVDEEQNRFRVLLPGEKYSLPPQKDKISPLFFLEEKDLSLSYSPEELQYKLIQQIDGIGPFLSQVIVEKVEEGENIQGAIKEIISPLLQNGYKIKVFFSSSGEPQGIFWGSATSYSSLSYKEFPSFNQAVECFHFEWWKRQEEFIRQKIKERRLKEELDFLKREREKIESLMKDEEELEDLKIKGELLKVLPGLEVISRTEEGIMVRNIFSSPPQNIFISLNPRLSLNQNMQNYFRLYRKGRERNLKLRERLKGLEEKERRVEKIFEEEPSFEKEEDKTSVSERALRFKTSWGSEIWVGKNAKSNHFLVTRIASPQDYWLHVRDLPGSHVILKTKSRENEEEEIQKAAQVAAYFSSVRGESRVEVILTQVKYVRPLPSQIGKVTYRKEKTLLVKPQLPGDVSPW